MSTCSTSHKLEVKGSRDHSLLQIIIIGAEM